jgi:hypothetical protein
MSEEREDPETRASKEEGVRRGGEQLPPEPGAGKDPDEPSEAAKDVGDDE